MRTVKRTELTSIKMSAGNEYKYSKVVIEGTLKEWVGIGWINLRDATEEDMATYPVMVES